MSLALLCPALLSAAVPRSGGGVTVRYFAYGSNLAASVREGRRKLSPISAEPGFVKDHRLSFSVPGFSPAEPAFASIARAPGQECHGGVYELGLSDWAKLCASEGVPFGYRVVEVQVTKYSGEYVQAWTLEGGLPAFVGDLPPSERYLELLRDGARELGLTGAWQERLAQVRTAPWGSGRRPPRAFAFERPGAKFV